MRAFATPAALAVLLAATTPAQAIPLYDRKPAEINGVRYGPEKVYEGDYITSFESSVFRPMGRPNEAIWLLGWQARPSDTTGGSHAYHIRFIGRRTTKPGKYGNLRAFSHQVVIAELINAEIEPAP